MQDSKEANRTGVWINNKEGALGVCSQALGESVTETQLRRLIPLNISTTEQSILCPESKFTRYHLIGNPAAQKICSAWAVHSAHGRDRIVTVKYTLHPGSWSSWALTAPPAVVVFWTQRDTHWSLRIPQREWPRPGTQCVSPQLPPLGPRQYPSMESQASGTVLPLPGPRGPARPAWSSPASGPCLAHAAH